MNTWIRLGAGVAGAAAVAAASWAWVRFSHWRRKDPVEIERRRRLELNCLGRITAGEIIDLIESRPPAAPARLVIYKYEVAGVTYEASQEVTPLPDIIPSLQSLAGQMASVKYDPKKPTNSIITCEEWNGLRRRDQESGIRG